MFIPLLCPDEFDSISISFPLIMMKALEPASHPSEWANIVIFPYSFSSQKFFGILGFYSCFSGGEVEFLLVRISQPVSVISRVCSNEADLFPSTVVSVQLSFH